MIGCSDVILRVGLIGRGLLHTTKVLSEDEYNISNLKC